MRNLEIECKWQANAPRAFACAWRVITSLSKYTVPRQLHITDVYLDDALQNLAAQKIALRVRNTNGKWEATYKTRTEIKNGKAVRREETLALPGVKNLRQALQVLARKKLWGKLNLTGLEAQFTLVNKRSVCVFDYDGAELEMALDDVCLYVLGRQVKFKEIEVELKRGAPAALDRFARFFTHETELPRAKISKVKTAQLLLNLWKK